MSLHQLANHMAAHGRGPDDRLVHMSGKEVAGLQALAKAHGGSLTQNPHTGLPEAGFLDNILPALVGAAGMYFGVDPMTTAAVMGGGTALKTHDLGKGIMAGMGAYGGGNMMQSAMGSGLVGAGPAAVSPTSVGPQMIGADLEQMSAANLPDNIDIGGGYNPASGTSPTPFNLENLGGIKNIGMAAAPAIMGMMTPQNAQPAQGTQQMIRPYTFAANPQTPANMVGTTYKPGQDTSERQWFQPQFIAQTPYKAAEGGLLDLGRMAAGGGPVEQMSNQAAIGANTMYPMANMTTSAFSTPYQSPRATNIIAPSGGATVNSSTGELNPQGTRLAAGGIASLGGYSDGGNLLRGPGDGVSDSIPATIGDKQPARLADGEFVVPARIVSELGNGSTDAGARQLYKMMDRVQSARGKTTGRGKVAKNTNASKFLPA